MRNRSQGWKFAKIGGHRLEEQLKKKISVDINFSNELHKLVFGLPYLGLAESRGGGKNAKKVPSVMGHLTQPKTDLSIIWRNGDSASISLKKSLGGQVWLVSLKHFLAGLDANYGVVPEKSVLETLGIFIGAPGYSEQIDFKKIRLKGPKHRSGKPLEVHQGRLCGNTIIENYPGRWEEMMRWMNSNIKYITELSFSRGLCKFPEDHAQYIWYYDLNQEKSRGVNDLYSIREIVQQIGTMKNPCILGDKNGGSTIQMPFGFLQMHSPGAINEMQFHHNYEKISQLTSRNIQANEQ